MSSQPKRSCVMQSAERQARLPSRGHARVWQQANSIAAPVIVLDRERQTLVARTTDASEPVRAVLLSAGGAAPGSDSAKAQGKKISLR